jgi:hypothetical protein
MEEVVSIFRTTEDTRYRMIWPLSWWYIEYTVICLVRANQDLVKRNIYFRYQQQLMSRLTGSGASRLIEYQALVVVTCARLPVISVIFLYCCNSQLSAGNLKLPVLSSLNISSF